MRHVTTAASIALCSSIALLYSLVAYRFSSTTRVKFTTMGTAGVNLDWYPPASSWVTNLTTVINVTGTFGFRFDGSDERSHGVYSYCNMEHVRPDDYVVPLRDEFELVYVEVIHRHHKRTPYAANGFPAEVQSWNCSDEGLFYSGRSLTPKLAEAADTYWSIFQSPSNPFSPSGLHGTCQFPQITSGGLDDSLQHGQDLRKVYHNMLGFLPDTPNDEVSFRVTNNVITSQVASMLLPGLFPSTSSKKIPVLVQTPSIDSLEPKYACHTADILFSNLTSATNPSWSAHLEAASPLYHTLDAVSGVPPDDHEFHKSIDHYFDNLSSRQCHDKSLPCSPTNSSLCITQQQADAVYRLGMYEYSTMFRGSPQSLRAAVGTFGVFFAELASHIRAAMSGDKRVVKYRHNIAHDGSLARVLAIMQVENMVWPGMGAEVVWEVYKKKSDGAFKLRVLWGGTVLVSSSPSLGRLDLLDLNVFLTYVDGLVGVDGVKVKDMCST